MDNTSKPKRRRFLFIKCKLRLKKHLSLFQSFVHALSLFICIIECHQPPTITIIERIRHAAYGHFEWKQIKIIIIVPVKCYCDYYIFRFLRWFSNHCLSLLSSYRVHEALEAKIHNMHTFISIVTHTIFHSKPEWKSHYLFGTKNWSSIFFFLCLSNIAMTTDILMMDWTQFWLYYI